jgi:hypothetical protein
MGRAVPPVARLAFGSGHRQARNGRGLASCWLSPVLDLEGAARPTRTARDFPRDPRPDPQDVPGESRLGRPPIHGELLKLGIDIGESSISKYMVRCRRPPSQTWRTFLDNHPHAAGLHRLLQRAHPPFPGTLRVSGSGP